MPPSLPFPRTQPENLDLLPSLSIPSGEWVKRYWGGAEPKGWWEGGAVKVQVWSRENEVTWYLVHRILGAGGGDGWVWGGQKSDQQGFREQRPVGWDGGPKRENRGAIGIRVSRQGALQAR